MSTASALTVEVPDIGDFDDVPIIEILVSPGDTVAVEDPLVTLESDKATMDVPAPVAGVVKTVSVKIGDRVSQGAPLMTIEATNGSDPAAVAAEDPPSARRPPRGPRPEPLRLPHPKTAEARSTPARRRGGWRASSASS
jgi:pyruvate dehydrogenase E2 component (dihydrolipoamide acetyltransferase)